MQKNKLLYFNFIIMEISLDYTISDFVFLPLLLLIFALILLKQTFTLYLNIPEKEEDIKLS